MVLVFGLLDLGLVGFGVWVVGFQGSFGGDGGGGGGSYRRRGFDL